MDDVALAHQQLLGLCAYCFDDRLGQEFLFVEARDALVEVHGSWSRRCQRRWSGTLPCEAGHGCLCSVSGGLRNGREARLLDCCRLLTWEPWHLRGREAAGTRTRKRKNWKRAAISGTREGSTATPGSSDVNGGERESANQHIRRGWASHGGLNGSWKSKCCAGFYSMSGAGGRRCAWVSIGRRLDRAGDGVEGVRAGGEHCPCQISRGP